VVRVAQGLDAVEVMVAAALTVAAKNRNLVVNLDALAATLARALWANAGVTVAAERGPARRDPPVVDLVLAVAGVRAPAPTARG
jgi:acetylglutamate kinase